MEKKYIKITRRHNLKNYGLLNTCLGVKSEDIALWWNPAASIALRIRNIQRGLQHLLHVLKTKQTALRSRISRNLNVLTKRGIVPCRDRWNIQYI